MLLVVITTVVLIYKLKGIEDISRERDELWRQVGRAVRDERDIFMCWRR